MAAKQGCVLTVESLLVHDGAAAQSLVVLLVAHERVHAQDSCGDKVGSMTLFSQTEMPSGDPSSTCWEHGKKHIHENDKLRVIFILALIHVTLRPPPPQASLWFWFPGLLEDPQAHSTQCGPTARVFPARISFRVCPSIFCPVLRARLTSLGPSGCPTSLARTSVLVEDLLFPGCHQLTIVPLYFFSFMEALKVMRFGRNRALIYILILS